MKREILFLMLLVIFIAGCNQQSTTEEDGPYIGGANGMTINFEPAAPVSEFSQDDAVPVRVKVTNKGEYGTKENTVYVRLQGVSQIEFDSIKDSFNYKSIDSSLFPAQKGISDAGGEAVVDLGNIEYNGVINGFVDRKLYADVCYPYVTSASVEACITSKRLEELGVKGICDYSGEKIKGGFVSSGPIQITTFTEELRGVDQISLKIGLQNKGIGKVYSSSVLCTDLDSSLVKLQNENKIFVEVLPKDIECSFSGGLKNSGFLTLDGSQEKILVCLLDVVGDSKYAQGIDIRTSYVYEQTTSTDIRVLA